MLIVGSMTTIVIIIYFIVVMTIVLITIMTVILIIIITIILIIVYLITNIILIPGCHLSPCQIALTMSSTPSGIFPDQLIILIPDDDCSDIFGTW